MLKNLLYGLALLVLGVSLGNRLLRDSRPSPSSNPEMQSPKWASNFGYISVEPMAIAIQGYAEAGPALPTRPVVKLVYQPHDAEIRRSFVDIEELMKKREARLPPPRDACRPPQCFVVMNGQRQFATERESRGIPTDSWQ